MTCIQCPVLSRCRTQIVYPRAGTNGLLMLGEAPGAEEDLAGENFAGPSGQKLRDLLAEQGICWAETGRASIVRCRPPWDRPPSGEEVQACLLLLEEFLRAAPPRVILTVGCLAARIFWGSPRLLVNLERMRRAAPRYRDVERAHVHLRGLLAKTPCAILVLPDTRLTAWNRMAPNGQRWSEIGQEQVALAARLLREHGDCP